MLKQLGEQLPSNGDSKRPYFIGKKGWSNSGNLITGKNDAVVTLAANFEGDPDTYTLEFSQTPNPNSNTPIYAEAFVTWMVEGNSISRRVTIANGMALSGVSQGVNAVIRDATPAMVAVPNNVVYGVSAQVTKGLRGISKQPPFWLPQNKVPPAGAGTGTGGGVFPVLAASAVSIVIPQDVGITSVLVTANDGTTNTNAAGKLQILQLYQLPSGVSTILKTYDSFIYIDWIPITPGANLLELNNTSADLYNCSVSFGVEG